jgi:hypothetical protein
LAVARGKIEIMKPVKIKTMGLSQVEKRYVKNQNSENKPRDLSFRFRAVDIGIGERPRCLQTFAADSMEPK